MERSQAEVRDRGHAKKRAALRPLSLVSVANFTAPKGKVPRSSRNRTVRQQSRQPFQARRLRRRLPRLHLIAHKAAGAARSPGIPCALCLSRDVHRINSGQFVPRERELMSDDVIARSPRQNCEAILRWSDEAIQTANAREALRWTTRRSSRSERGRVARK